jgi:hypothetical protein
MIAATSSSENSIWGISLCETIPRAARLQFTRCEASVDVAHRRGDLCGLSPGASTAWQRPSPARSPCRFAASFDVRGRIPPERRPGRSGEQASPECGDLLGTSKVPQGVLCRRAMDLSPQLVRAASPSVSSTRARNARC